MLDSINFRINGVRVLDRKRLMDLKITYHKFKYKFNKFGRPYMDYGKVKENETGILSTGISFEYDKMHFQYYDKWNYVIIIANAHKVLGKTDITLSDRDIYIDKVKQAVSTTLNIEYSKVKLYRCDYCVDIEMSQDEIIERIKLLYKHEIKYDHIIRINDYETSIYLTSKGGQKRINIYDKYVCEKTKYFNKYYKEREKTGISLAEYEMKHAPYYEYYKGIFRVEVQNTKYLIQKASKDIENKYSKLNNTQIPEHLRQTRPRDPIKANIMERNLDGYWNQDTMGKYFFKLLKGYLHTGIHYKLKDAVNIIKKSQLYTKNEKAELIKFITAVNKFGISGVTKTEKQNAHQVWCIATIYRYMDNLVALGINILLVDKNKQFNLNNAKAIIDKSAHTDDWKSKLFTFLKAVKMYGVANIKASNNNEIANNIKTSRHKLWCKSSVDKYIQLLKKENIHPVTLDNNSKFDSLESLFTLATKTAKEKYFDIQNQDIPMPPIELQPRYISIRNRRMLKEWKF